MASTIFEVLLADLKTKTELREFVDCFLKGMTFSEIRCYTNEIMTYDIFREHLEKNSLFQIDVCAEKDIPLQTLLYFKPILIEGYTDLLKTYLRDEDTAPQFKYTELKEIEFKLKENQVRYDPNSILNFYTDFKYRLISSDSTPTNFLVTFYQMKLSEEALHSLNDTFKVRHELISNLLQLTEEALVNLEIEKEKKQQFKLDQKKGAMLISEFVVALTDDKDGLLKIDKKGKQILAKQLFDQFGLNYKKWPEYDVLCRDKPSKSLDSLCEILTKRKFPKKSYTKNN